MLVTHALRADGFDASEDGTGRGTPLVPVAFDTTQITSRENRSNPQPGDPCHPLAAGSHPPLVAFSCKDHGADAGDLAPTLRAMGHAGSHPNAGGQVAIAFTEQSFESGEITPTLVSGGKGGGKNAINLPHVVAFDLRGREGGSQFEGPHDTANIRAASGGSSRSYVAQSGVRRLTPRECERLQGFPDDFTLVPCRGKPAADGPRYKAIGNSMAVPCMRWIGERIDMVRR